MYTEGTVHKTSYKVKSWRHLIKIENEIEIANCHVPSYIFTKQYYERKHNNRGVRWGSIPQVSGCKPNKGFRFETQPSFKVSSNSIGTSLEPDLITHEVSGFNPCAMAQVSVSEDLGYTLQDFC